MILVTGGTGRAGSQVVRALVERDQDVRILVRDPDKAHALFGGGVELAVGDFDDKRAVSAAIDGVERIFLSGPDDPRRLGWETAVIEMAKSAGVQQIVKLSSLVAEPGASVAFWDWHGRVEHHLQSSGVPAVILRSNFFMTNLLVAAEQVASEARLYAPAAGARIGMIDPRDVGAVAAAVLTEPGHDRRTYVLTGPQCVTYAQVATAMSAVCGSDVQFVDIPDEAARHGIVQTGVPALIAEQIVNVFAAARKGAAERVTATVETLTGRPPGDLASFIRDHADLFTPVTGVAP